MNLNSIHVIIKADKSEYFELKEVIPCFHIRAGQFFWPALAVFFSCFHDILIIHIIMEYIDLKTIYGGYQWSYLQLRNCFASTTSQ